MGYNDNLGILKGFGFGVITLMLCRLILLFSSHPRLAVLVRTLAAIVDHMYHFLIYFACIGVILTFIAWWMFAGPDATNFGTVEKTLYTEAKMHIGDFPFPESSHTLDVFLGAYFLIYVV